jgi:hypothetical protein
MTLAGPPQPPRFGAFGLSVQPPGGWDARVALRRPDHAQEQTFPVMHMASFPLPEQRDDFGGNLTPFMRSSDTFVTLFEYGPAAAHAPLFAAQGVPRVDATMFSPNQLQRRRPGQLGCQRFFTANGRAFCLYVVAGSRASLGQIVTQVNAMLAAIDVEAHP